MWVGDSDITSDSNTITVHTHIQQQHSEESFMSQPLKQQTENDEQFFSEDTISTVTIRSLKGRHLPVELCACVVTFDVNE